MKHVCRCTTLALIFAALAPGALAASAKLSGTYETTVSSAGSLNGTYRITFSPGKFVLRGPYGTEGHGTYSISGSRMAVHGPGACKATGTYDFKVSGSSLTFKKLSDPCPRAAILTAHALKKV